MDIDTIDVDTRTQEILLAATNHDLETLKPFLRTPGAASVQDPETGFTPLHAAIAACGPSKSVKSDATNGRENGEPEDEDNEEVDLEKAKATVKELLLSGAIWNDLDANDETPGCVAWRLGQTELYDMVVDAGVRAELLMNLMGGYEELESEDEEDDNEATEEDPEDAPELVSQGDSEPMPADGNTTEPSPKADGAVEAPKRDVNSTDYLNSELSYDSSKLLDSDANGVMMSWETPIMELTSQLLAPSPGLRILNIGFGMGIIDRCFTATQPSSHHIIEAHPDVISALKRTDADAPFPDFGADWLAKDGGGKNVIHEGKWQDIVPKLLERGEVFDAIYFDTFAESYTQLKLFFSEYVISLLSEEGRFSFFNGLGADRRVCYDVYTRVSECDLADAGLDVQWLDVEVDMGDQGEKLGKDGEGEWKGVRRRYWTLETYRLPVCTFMG
jgi:protein arginine N-methyltransferase 2